MAVLLDTIEGVITVNEVGVWRVAGTRVSVDSVIYEFKQGASPEEIVYSFDTLDLKKVYAVINYYLHNQEKVEQYLAESEKKKEAIYREIERDFPTKGLREKLLARRPRST